MLQDEADHNGVTNHDGATADAALPPDDDGGGGLEIDVNGSWMPVIPQPGSFVVNIGDLFELWTNNRWRSTPHRVASPRIGTAAAERSRLTAMLFTGPSLETIVQPAPTCCPSLYPSITAREHLTAMATTKSKEAQYKSKEAECTSAEQTERDTLRSVAEIAAKNGHLDILKYLLTTSFNLDFPAIRQLAAEYPDIVGWCDDHLAT